jgi:hypothetical protein
VILPKPSLLIQILNLHLMPMERALEIFLLRQPFSVTLQDLNDANLAKQAMKMV